MTFRQRKGWFYQKVHVWALRRWRKTLNNPTLRGYVGKVSTHAIVRYMERIEGRDIAKELMTPEVKRLVKEVGGSGKFVSNGVLFTVDKGVVMTVCRPHPGQAQVSGLNKDSNIARKWSF